MFLKKLTGSGLEVLEMYSYNRFSTLGWIWQGKILK